MPVLQAFLEKHAQTDPEINKLQTSLTKRNIPIELFTKKQLFRKQLKLLPTTLVAGDLPVIRQALKQLDITEPQIVNYPSCLSHLLYRKQWLSILDKVIANLENASVFIKPAEKVKRFTGFVLNSPYDLWQFNGASKRLEVICSEVVNWVSEFRCFVVNGKFVGMSHYYGEKQIVPDIDTIKNSIAILNNTGYNNNGYAIDFGVLSSGQTALIELNDGYSMGSYDLSADLYTDLIVARWEQMVSSHE